MDRLLPTAVLLLAVGCGQDAAAPAAEAGATERVVLATSYPIAWVAERLCGPDVPVECPVPPDADPITWRPPRDVLERFRGAALVVANGARFERWLDTASLPPSRLVRSADAFEDRWLHYATTTHSHGPRGEHTHAGVDGHTWMDPDLLSVQAAVVHEALRAAFPDVDASARFADLEHALDELQLELKAVGEEIAAADVDLVCSHPAWNYVLRAWGREAAVLDLDPDAELTDDDVADVAAARTEGRRAVVLWESEPRPASAARLLQELGAVSVVYSPAETAPPDGRDWLAIQRDNLARLRAALAP